MSDDEGELAPTPPPKWSSPPVDPPPPPPQLPPLPPPPGPPSHAPPPPPKLPPLPPPPGPPTSSPLSLSGPAFVPGPAPPAGPSFADYASKMGRELSKVTPLFRLAGVLVLAGALTLAAENGMIFASSVNVAQDAQGLLNANNTSAQGVVALLSSTQGFFDTLTLATQLDIIGFSLLGSGALLLGLGSLGIEMRSRFDGDTRRPSKLLLVLGLGSGVSAFMWVAFTVNWRTQLTGSPTGDWSFVPGMFNLFSIFQTRAIPPEVTTFTQVFGPLSQTWIMAAVLQVPAALLFYAWGWAIKRETGIKVGGLSWVAFSIVALIGTVVFITTMMGIVQAVQRVVPADPSTYEDLPQALGLQMAVGGAIKLIVLPFYGLVSFLILSFAGLRLLKIKPGRVIMGDRDLKAILQTPSVAAPAPPFDAGPAPAAPTAPVDQSPSATAVSTALPTQQEGDIVVALEPPKPPPKAP